MTLERVHLTVVDCLNRGRTLVIIQQSKLAEPRAWAHILCEKFLFLEVRIIGSCTRIVHSDFDITLYQYEILFTIVSIFDEGILLEVGLGPHGARQLRQLLFSQILCQKVGLEKRNDSL